MNRQEYNEYKEAVESNFGKCTILKSKCDHYVKNAGNTSGRKAYNSKDWIEYWQAMTGRYDRILTCSSCGKVIIVGTPTLEEYIKFSTNGDDVKNHKAEGGHIWVTAPKEADYTGGRYITPLCPFCNGQRGQQINILKGSKYCKELGATIKK